MDMFVKGFLLSLSLCLDLGIVNVAVMKAGLERGFKPSFLLGVGSAFGDAAYLALALFGMAMIFQYKPVRLALWVGGTAILLYFTWKMIRETVRPNRTVKLAGGETNGSGTAKAVVRGLGLALASPTSILWFAAVASPILATSRMGKEGAALFGLGFFIAGIAWSALVALLSSRLGQRLGTVFARTVSMISAGLFLYFAVRVFAEGFNILQS